MSPKRRTSNGKRILIILNPTAGRKRAAFLRKTLQKLQRSGADVALQRTQYPGHAEELARAALRGPEGARPHIVVAAGGDGTINEVANGLLGGPVPLGIIPMGTANVLARDIGLRQRSGLVARTLTQGQANPIHLGKAGARHFLMMAGIGFDARVVEKVDLGLKQRLGRTAYALAGLRELLFGSRKLFDVTIDGQTYRSGWVVVAKGQHFGGGYIVARDARLEDPSLIACILPGTRRIDLVRYLLAIGLGRITRQPDVTFVRTRSVEIAHADAMEIDGDFIDPAPFRLSIGGSLDLVQPA